ncbi:uncharacterized protein AB675_9373 [Cyphellophora attinorum]|uniref:DUF7587 domain-containing protein n=1 Tax=Cyphellophora attinorum TaxID=1664694 RepID=A0A0N0NNI9_9EURO|nr:uncharacterized protein AB675_9373 [Phialophora attinorum]KPI41429.1 hypothetical protein AB675_9373 [Phialophora attinorum]
MEMNSDEEADLKESVLEDAITRQQHWDAQCKFGDDADLDLEIERSDEHFWAYKFCSPGWPSNDSKVEYAGPDLRKIADVTARLMPRYLYRVTHPRSQGVNEEGLYRSGSVKAGLGLTNFFDVNKDCEHIKSTLTMHLRKQHTPSPWISFSDSIVATLARALRFQQRKKTKPEDIRIHVIDTMNIRRLALGVNGRAIAFGYRALGHNSSKDTMVRGSLPGEYLFWNVLNVDASTVSLSGFLCPWLTKDNVRSPGLLELIPQLTVQPRAKGSKKLAKPDPATTKSRQASQLLDKLYGSETVIRKRIAVEKVRDHQKLVGGLKLDFRLPVLLALLSMHTKSYHNEGIVEAMCQVYEGASEVENFEFASTGAAGELRIDVEKFEELGVMVYLALKGKHAVRGGKVDDLRRNLSRIDGVWVNTTHEMLKHHCFLFQYLDAALDTITQHVITTPVSIPTITSASSSILSTSDAMDATLTSEFTQPGDLRKRKHKITQEAELQRFKYFRDDKGRKYAVRDYKIYLSTIAAWEQFSGGTEPKANETLIEVAVRGMQNIAAVAGSGQRPPKCP